MGFKPRATAELPFRYYGRVSNDVFLPRTFSCRVWLRAPIDDMGADLRALVPAPLRNFVLVDGHLVCIGSSGANEYQREKTIQFLVKQAYEGKSEVPAFDPADVPAEHLELVKEIVADWSDASVWDRLATDVDTWLAALHRRAPIAVAAINWLGPWLGRNPYTAWHEHSVAALPDGQTWAQLAAAMTADTPSADHARQLASSVVYFLTDNPSVFDSVAHDPAYQTVLANLGWGPEAERAIALLAARVPDPVYAEVAARATTLSTVYRQRSFSDIWVYTAVGTPSDRVWVIQAGKRAFYLRAPIVVNAYSREDAPKDRLSMPEWGIDADIDTITTAHIDFARAFNARYEQLIKFGAPSSDDDRRFVARYHEHVARIVSWFDDSR